MSTAGLPLGYRRIHLPDIDSTSDEARRQAEAGAAAGLVVTANRQTSGRGRRGREWSSPVGNLYCSILLRPDFSPGEAALSGFAVSVAVAEVVARAIGDEPPVHCKWPNDVLVGDFKVAGILVESSSAGAAVVDWLIVGVGINVRSHPELPDKPATDLAACGASVLPDELLDHLVRAIDDNIARWQTHGFNAIRERWLKRAWRLGQRVDLLAGGERIAGAFSGLDSQGGIVLELEGGERRNLGHGELLAHG